MLILCFVTVKPRFLEVPPVQKFVDGSDAVIECPAFFGAEQDTRAEMLWVYKGNTLSMKNNRFTPEDGLLTIHNIRRSDGDFQYTCRLHRYPDGFIDSGRTITVEVIPRHKFAPKINSTMPRVEVTYGQSLNLSCDLEEKKGNVTYSWTIKTKHESNVLTNSSLLHRAPHTFVGGIYTCKAENKFGYDIVDFSVKILGKLTSLVIQYVDFIINNVSCSASLSTDLLSGEESIQSGYNGRSQVLRSHYTCEPIRARVPVEKDEREWRFCRHAVRRRAQC